MKKSEVSAVANNNPRIVTFGCRLNIYESEIIRKNLQSNNLNDIIVFNTCTVTKSAEYQAKKAIRKAKRENPQVKIIVTGCAAQSNPDMFVQMPEVDKILGNEEKLHAKFYDFNLPTVIVNDIMSVTETAEHMVEHFVGKTRAFIQIQNGCDHCCTFCIIPHVRGNSRSVTIGAITQQIKLLVAQGYKEVVFTGVDLTSYGSGLPGTPTLAQMIKRVLALVPNLPRLRLSSLDVAEIDDELFDLLVHEPRLMPHVHISLQAGDNMILKRMKRRHTREQIVDFCLKLRNLVPDISFGADMIAGFPTESPEMFDNSFKLISEVGLQHLHVFPYSERPNTPASRMPQVAKHIRKQRANMLIEAGKAQLHAFFQRHIGKVVSVLIEQEQFGHSENFIPIFITTKQEIGSIVNVKLIGINNDNNMVGEAIAHD